ncbi:MAG TPA: ABC transporter permease [Blastocatellia bacterium]|nr:ABC transporter permease [Blastocatellia bacterium]
MASSIQSKTIGGALPSIDARPVTIIRAPSVSPFGLIKNLTELAHYRDLLYTLTVHRIKVRYKQSLLGGAWAVIQPLSMMLIFTLVFSLIARVPSDGAPYALFAYVALLAWNCFSTAIANSTAGLVSHSQLVTKVYFPREILPLTYVLAALFDFLIASSVLAVLMLYYGVPLTLNALYALPIILVLALLATAIALLLSATQARFRDVGVAVPLVLQLWMFATPIIYPLSAVPARFRPLYLFNPMVGVIENFRRVILRCAPPDFNSLGTSAFTAALLLIASYIYFKRVEATMADII